MTCCEGCAKYSLLIFNLFVWIAGAAVLGVGIYLRVGGNVEAVVEVGDLDIYYAGCYIMIAAGALMFLLGFLGCCGAMTENKCGLGLYSFFLFILFVIEVGLAIWACVNVDEIDTAIEEAFNDTLVDGSDPDDPITQSVIVIQKDFKCCGLTNGCSDWMNGQTYGCSCDPTASGNHSCVLATSLNCTNEDGGDYIYEEGCYDAVVEFLEDNVWLAIGIAFAIGFAELIGIVFSIIVCKSGKNSSYDGIYA